MIAQEKISWCCCVEGGKVPPESKRGTICATCDLPWKPTGSGGPEPVKVNKLPGRNDPCNCGSGKKFKKCCWEKHVHYGNIKRGVMNASRDLLVLDHMGPEAENASFKGERERIKVYIEEVTPWLKANERFA